MKAFVFSLALMGSLATGMFAQDASNDSDKKWRFGLRVNPQGCWLLSNDKNNIPEGWKIGTGFGLNVEYRFSPVAAILTGIGGDIEGGRYNFKFDPDNNYVVSYVRDADNFVAPDSKAATRLHYILKQRDISTTHVTLPFLLKLNTQEYDGFKYFGQFGLELGVRVKATVTDKYYEVRKTDDLTGIVTTVSYDSEEKDIDLTDESTLVPLRLGLNAGMGFEYRLGGSTSCFVSFNFFRGFTNQMKKESDFAYYRIEGGNFQFIKQNLKQSAIRINLGIMF